MNVIRKVFSFSLALILLNGVLVGLAKAEDEFIDYERLFELYDYEVQSTAKVASRMTLANSSLVTAPTHLRPYYVMDTAVILIWESSTSTVGEIKSYEIYRNNVLVRTSTYDNAITVTGLSPNQSYTFTVRAVDSLGNVSPFSEPLILNTGKKLFEPNDSPETATEMLFNTEYQTDVFSPDRDFFKFTAESSTTNLLLTSRSEMNITIYNSKNEVVGVNSNLVKTPTSGLNRRYVFSTVPAVDYYIKVEGNSYYRAYLSSALTQYEYNDLGRLVSSSTDIGSLKKIAKYKYDEQGNLLKANLFTQTYGVTNNDTNPVQRPIEEYPMTNSVSLDVVNRSIGVSFTSSQNVTEIELRDSDSVSRLKSSDYRIYESKDGYTYNLVNNWTFSSMIGKDNRLVHIFTFPQLNTKSIKINTIYSDRNASFNLKLETDFKIHVY